MTVLAHRAPGDSGHIADTNALSDLLEPIYDASLEVMAGGQGPLAGRPVAGSLDGEEYWADDVPALYRWDGSTWHTVAVTSAANTWTAPQQFDDEVYFGSGAPWCDVKAKGAVGDGGTDDHGAFAAAHDFVPDGGTIYIPPTPTGSDYKLNSTWALSKTLKIIGPGYQTRLLFAAGVAGITTDGNKCGFSRIYDLYLQSQSTVAGTDDGFKISSSRLMFFKCTADRFGRYGFNFDATSPNNANNCNMIHCRSVSNKSHGYRLNGGDCNVIHWTHCEAVSNSGWGWYMPSGSNCHLDNPHEANNVLGGWYLNGSSNRLTCMYSEGHNTCQLDTSADNHILDTGLYAYPTFVDTGSNNRITMAGRENFLLVAPMAAGSTPCFQSHSNTGNTRIGTLGSDINQIKSITTGGSLNFGALAANGGAQDIDIPSIGTVVGDNARATPAATSGPPAGCVIQSWAITDAVRVRCINVTAAIVDPPAVTFREFVVEWG